jgi:uncharacterized protein YqhQ
MFYQMKWRHDILHNDMQHNNAQKSTQKCNTRYNFTLSVILLSIIVPSVAHTECLALGVVKLIAVMPIVMALSEQLHYQKLCESKKNF